MRPWKKLPLKSKYRRIRYSLLKLLRRLWGDYKQGGICGLYHWLRCNIWNRYHVINLRKEVGWGWVARDYLLLHASFKILKDFVEEEDPQVGLRTIEDYRYEGMPDDEVASLEEHQLNPAREIRALYDWWTKERATVHAALYAEPGDTDRAKKVLTPLEREAALQQKDEDMLCRLARIRPALWT